MTASFLLLHKVPQTLGFNLNILNLLTDVSYGNFFARKASIIPLPLFTLLDNVEKTKLFSFLPFQVLGWSSVTKYRLTRKTNRRLLTRISHIYMEETQG